MLKKRTVVVLLALVLSAPTIPSWAGERPLTSSLRAPWYESLQGALEVIRSIFLPAAVEEDPDEDDTSSEPPQQEPLNVFEGSDTEAGGVFEPEG